MQKPVEIFGIYVNPCTENELNAYLCKCLVARKKQIVAHVNVFALNLAFNKKWLRKFFNQSGLVFADGAGVVLAGKLLGHAIPQRITYADWMWKLAELAEENGFSLFFLGGRPGIAEQAAANLLNKYPRLNIVGCNHGYFNKTKSSPENKELIEKINAVKPDILVVGFGMPLQEKWLMENWDDLDSTIALTGGAVFDYISGNLKRAPRWMTDHSFEWLGRLIIEPGRLWKRYLIGNPLFFWRVFKQKFGLLKSRGDEC